MYRWNDDRPTPEDAWGNLLAFQDPRNADAALSLLPDLIVTNGQGNRRQRAALAAWKKRAALARRTKSC